MDILLEIEKILTKWGHKLDHSISPCISSGCLDYTTEHNNIISISIHLKGDTDIDFYIVVKLSSSKIYANYGYSMDPPMDNSDHVCGSKNFQSFEDLLDELQDLGLINCGQNIKG